MLEVVDGSEDWKLLHQLDYGNLAESYRYKIRKETDRDVLVDQSQIRPTFLDGERFAVQEMQGSGRVVPARGSLPILVSLRFRTNWRARLPTSTCRDHSR